MIDAPAALALRLLPVSRRPPDPHPGRRLPQGPGGGRPRHPPAHIRDRAADPRTAPPPPRRALRARHQLARAALPQAAVPAGHDLRHAGRGPVRHRPGRAPQARRPARAIARSGSDGPDRALARGGTASGADLRHPRPDGRGVRRCRAVARGWGPVPADEGGRARGGSPRRWNRRAHGDDSSAAVRRRRQGPHDPLLRRRGRPGARAAPARRRPRRTRIDGSTR